MKKTLYIISLAVIFAGIFAISGCQKEENTVKNEKQDLLTVLEAKYGVTDIKKGIDFNNKNLNINSDEFNLSDATEFVFSNFDTRVILLPFSKQSNKYYVLKCSQSAKMFKKEKDLFVRIFLDNEGNGFIELLDKDDNIINSFSLEHGIPIGQLASKRSELNKGKGWCQREGNETTGDCYRREVNEFCDGFLGCAALATHTEIHLLILAMCSC